MKITSTAEQLEIALAELVQDGYGEAPVFLKVGEEYYGTFQLRATKIGIQDNYPVVVLEFAHNGTKKPAPQKVPAYEQPNKRGSRKF